MANLIQIRRGPSANVPSITAKAGELIWVSDIQKLYIGIGNNKAGFEGLKVISPNASEVEYNNTTSGLTATNVQAAIDELVVNLADCDSKLDEKKQDKLGGTGQGGKVVIASETLGEVTYLPIDADQPTDGSLNLITSNAVYDAIETLRVNVQASLDALTRNKQDKVTTAVENNIALWDAAGNTKDGGVKIVTAVGPVGTDTNIPSEKAVRDVITDTLTSAITYEGTCKESDLVAKTKTAIRGDYWAISDFDITFADQEHIHTGRAIRNKEEIPEGTTIDQSNFKQYWDYLIERFHMPDDVTLELSSTGEIKLKDITTTKTTSTQTGTFSGTVDVVDTVTTNEYGQVTTVNTKTVTLPSLGKSAGQAAKGDEAEYTANKTNDISGTVTDDTTKYPSVKAVKTELDKKADKVTNTASTNYSLVNYNDQGIVIGGTDIIDGGTF